MGKVDCCSLPGYELRFPSQDHAPPHVHVRRPGEWEIKVRLLTTTSEVLDWEPKWPRSFEGPRRNVRLAIGELIAANRAALLKEFYEKVSLE